MSAAPLFTLSRPLVLASGSPRRKALLLEAGLDLPVRTPEAGGAFHEPAPCPGEAPEAYALRAAEAKARAVAPFCPEAGVISADTIVVLPGAAGARPAILGKPRDADAALAMLRSLAGRSHTVITACCVLPPDRGEGTGVEVRTDTGKGTEPGEKKGGGERTGRRKAVCLADAAEVTFGRWPDAALAAYARCKEPLDKAGAYAIQGRGAFLVEGIKGSWSTVVGLPVPRLLRLLLELGLIAVAEAGPGHSAAVSR